MQGRQDRQEERWRQERRQRSKPSQNLGTHKDVVRWHWEEKPLEYGMLFEPQEQVRIRRRATQSRQRNTKERHGQMRELFGTRRPNCSCETTTATSSRTLSGQHCLRNVLDHFRRLVGMDIRHECGDFGISIGCKDWHRNRGERM